MWWRRGAVWCRCEACGVAWVCVRCRDWAQYGSTSADVQQDTSRIIPDQYIVVFDSFDTLMKAQDVLQSMEAPTDTQAADAQSSVDGAASRLPVDRIGWKRPSIVLQFDSLFHGFTVTCSADVLETLARQEGLLAIVPDEIVTLDDSQAVGADTVESVGESDSEAAESRLRGSAPSRRSLTSQSR